MQVKTVSAVGEKAVLAAMITDRGVLATVADRWEDHGLFDSKWANLVGMWCVTFFKKYAKAPGRAIQDLYDSWAARSKDADTAELVADYLAQVSADYVQLKKDVNPQFALDQAARVFNKVRYKGLADGLGQCVDMDDMDAAAKQLSAFRAIEVGDDGWVNPVTDDTAAINAFSSVRE